jgi:hypothetical protein
LWGKSNKQIAYQQQELSLASYNYKSNIIEAQKGCTRENKIYFLIMVVKMDHEIKEAHKGELERSCYVANCTTIMIPITQKSLSCKL